MAEVVEENSTNSQGSHFESAEQPRSLKYNPALDGLRGIAILLVLLHHSSQVPRDRESVGSWFYGNLSAMGWIGVDLFFVLSGFLISSILLKSFGRPNWLRNFVARRALRVLPLYFVVIFFCFNVMTWLPYSGLDWLRELSHDQWWYWLHLANFRKIVSSFDPSVANVGWFSTYWSLSIEEHFYLVWPVVLAVFGPRKFLRIAVVGVVLVNLLRWVVALNGWDESLIYNNTFTRVDGLLLGSAIAWLKENDPARLKKLGWLAAVVAVSSALCFWLPATMGISGGGRKTFYGATVLYPASVFGGGAICWYLVTQPQTNWLNRMMASRILVLFGKYSYAIYVFNKPIIYGIAVLVRTYFGPLNTFMAAVVLGVICVACLVVGGISWRLIEHPFLRLKKYFPSRTRERDLSSAIKT